MNQTERMAQENNGYQHKENTIMKELQKPLTAMDIDFRVGRSGMSNSGAWATLMAYKDSRVDMRRLDESTGGMWSNTYKRDNKGILQCEISILMNGEWVSKVSNGTASQFESEKGEYSDAFKRAGFMWGIGRELYDLPELPVMLHDSEFWLQDAESKKPKVNMTYQFKPNEWVWHLDWEHLDPHGNKGLIHAKQKGSSSYRVKPKSIFLKHQIR